MKKFPLGHVALLAVTVLPLSAQTPVAPRAGGSALESFAEFSFAGAAPIAQGTLPLGDISSFHGRIGVSRQRPHGARSAWLIGASWQDFSFRAPAGAPIPSSLDAVALQFGWDVALDEPWSFRAEIDPGLYGELDDIGAGTFNAPAGFRFVRAASRDLQWIFGFNLDLRCGHPLVAGLGARWQLAPALALDVAAGWVLDRRFEFHERDLLLNGDGAPSAQPIPTGTF